MNDFTTGYATTGIKQAPVCGNGPVAPITSAVKNTAAELESLHQELSLLHEELAAVLRASSPEAGTKEQCREAPASPLHDDMLRMRDSVSLARSVISSIRARLTV